MDNTQQASTVSFMVNRKQEDICGFGVPGQVYCHCFAKDVCQAVAQS